MRIVKVQVSLHSLAKTFTVHMHNIQTQKKKTKKNVQNRSWNGQNQTLTLFWRDAAYILAALKMQIEFIKDHHS